MKKNLETGINLQTQQEESSLGMKYCPSMDDILLPVYTPVSYKPGYSGNSDQAEHLCMEQTYKKVCMLCMDGPRCKFNTVKEQFSVDSINAPSAIDDKAAHSDCKISVPIIVLGSAREPVLAHTKGDTHEPSLESGNIKNLIEKWDRQHSLWVDSDKVGEGERGNIKVYSARRVSQEFRQLQDIFEQTSQEVPTTDESSVTLLNLSFKNIPTKSKGSVRKVSRIPRRDISSIS